MNMIVAVFVAQGIADDARRSLPTGEDEEVHLSACYSETCADDELLTCFATLQVKET